MAEDTPANQSLHPTAAALLFFSWCCVSRAAAAGELFRSAAEGKQMHDRMTFLARRMILSVEILQLPRPGSPPRRAGVGCWVVADFVAVTEGVGYENLRNEQARRMLRGNPVLKCVLG
jgi:hypothetical protein